MESAFLFFVIVLSLLNYRMCWRKMDKRNKNLYKTRMTYFDQLTVTYHGRSPEHPFLVRETWSEFALNYAHSGEMFYRYEDGERHERSAPLAWWVYPGRAYEFGTTGRSWDHHYIQFEGPRLRRWLRKGLFPKDRYPFVPIARVGEFKQKWDELLGLLRRTLGRGGPRAVLLLEDILLQMIEEADRPTSEPVAVERVRQLIGDMSRDPLKASHLVKAHHQCGVSAAHFRRLFGKEAGMSPVQYLLKLQMQQAAQLLVTTPLPVKIVAEHCGFTDIYYFSKLFKRHMGRPPRQYRLQWSAL